MADLHCNCAALASHQFNPFTQDWERQARFAEVRLSISPALQPLTASASTLPGKAAVVHVATQTRVTSPMSISHSVLLGALNP